MSPYTGAYVNVRMLAEDFADAWRDAHYGGYSLATHERRCRDFAIARVRLELACAVYRVISRRAIR
jgi:hypothetical protein